MPALVENYLRNLPLNVLQLQEFLEELKAIFRKEPNILKVSRNPCSFIGDTHGDLETSKRIVEEFLTDEKTILIFLGDYVDRGAYQLENVLFLFSLKKDYPERVILLRGNHEEEEMNKSYGFHEILYTNYMRKSDEVFQQFQQTFAQLPLCVLTWNQVLGLHGGIPISLEKGVISLTEIEQLKRGATHFEQFDPITVQLLWNDPNEMPGATPSPRGVGFNFGPDKFEEFISFNKIGLVIRSHEVFPMGYKTFFGDKLISIFSAQNYIYHQQIQAKIVKLDVEGNVALMGFAD
jgi:diadenosine tetraphosphatase ApaH/serine/threonine PP2A family protein phosphatase